MLVLRSKTMKVTVKASNVEKALQPYMWPFRVSVRHYRAPYRPECEGWSQQSARSGGRQEDSSNQEQTLKYNNQRNHKKSNQKQMAEWMNFFSAVGEQECP